MKFDSCALSYNNKLNEIISLIQRARTVLICNINNYATRKEINTDSIYTIYSINFKLSYLT